MTTFSHRNDRSTPNSQGTGSPVPAKLIIKLSFRSPLGLRNLLLTFAALSIAAFAQQAERGIMVREAQLYVSPDSNSQKLARVGRGREVAVIERSHDYIKVLANIKDAPVVGAYEDQPPGLSITGWILDKGVVRSSTPNGDKVLFGEGADSEAEAQKAHGRRGAAEDAMRLYAETAEYFPNSPLAGEALWRSADIRWQIDRSDAGTRKSSKARESYLHPEIDDHYLRQVEKKFPNSKWSDQAAFDLLDKKLCGEWEGLPKCPEDETGMYEKYVKEHPTSPKNAEALYEAAWRQAALVDIYKSREDAGKANNAKSHALNLCQQIESINTQGSGDWAQRAARLRYLLEQGISTFGNAID